MATYAQITRCITDEIGRIAGTGSRAYGEWVSMGSEDRNHYAARVFARFNSHPELTEIDVTEAIICNRLAHEWCARHEEISNG
jgi:hypothetical protein